MVIIDEVIVVGGADVTSARRYVAHRAGAAFAVFSAAGVLEQDVSGVDYTDGSEVSLWNSETRVDRGV